MFNNVSPLKLQNLSGVTSFQGKVLLRTSGFGPMPRPDDSVEGAEVLSPDIVRELNRVEDPQGSFDKDSQARAEEEEQREREEQRKRGTQACS